MSAAGKRSKFGLTSAAALSAAAACGVATVAPPAANAQTVTTHPATFDRWMYPFGATPGTEIAGSSFGAVATDGFDDRDAQFLVGFGTSSTVTPGLGAASYNVTSARVSVRIVTGNTFLYDPTEDAVASYAEGGTDADAGRPIELHGVGYRGGFNEASFSETTGFGLAGGPAEAVRRAFAADYNGTTAVDVSNNVTGPDLDDVANDSFDANAWAVGHTSAAAAGGSVPADATFTFDLDLTDSDVLAYVQRGLDAGGVRFALSSLHAASFGGAPAYPRFYTREHPSGPAFAPSLEVTLLPEPATGGVLLAGAIAAATLTGRRRRRPPIVVS